jgi:hypothetical protein
MPHRSYMVAPQGGGSVTPPPSVRRWNQGWYTALSGSQIYAGAPGQSAYTGIPGTASVTTAGPYANGSIGIMVPHAWAELEPNGVSDPNRFSGFSLFTQDLAAAATIAAISPGWNVNIILKLVVKSENTYGGNILLPADMVAVADAGNGLKGGTGTTTYATATSAANGYFAWRWHPVVIARLQALFAQLNFVFGGNVGNNVHWAGVAMQETAPSGPVNVGGDGYGTDNSNYIAGLIAEAKNIVAGNPYIRPYQFMNFMPMKSNAQGTYDLASVLLQTQQYGSVAGFPDTVTKNAGIISRVYPIMQAYSQGGSFTDPSGVNPKVVLPGNGGVFGSIQPAEWTGGTPGDSPVNLANLFNYFTSSFTFGGVGSGAKFTNAMWAGALDWSGAVPANQSPLTGNIMVPDWHLTGSPVFDPGVSAMMALAPSFNIIAPNP